MVLRKQNCACPDRVPLQNFFFDNAASHAKISLSVLDAFESSSASILSLRLGFLDKSNLLKIPDCPTVDLKKVLSVTKHGFVSEPSARQTLHLRFIKHFRSACTVGARASKCYEGLHYELSSGFYCYNSIHKLHAQYIQHGVS